MMVFFIEKLSNPKERHVITRESNVYNNNSMNKCAQKFLPSLIHSFIHQMFYEWHLCVKQRNVFFSQMWDQERF